MFLFLKTIFDLIFPRRDNDAAIADISPEDFYERMPRWDEEAYPGMSGIFHYQHPSVKAMIKEIKSSHNRHAARIAAYALSRYMVEHKLTDNFIIPIPISKKRRKKRGYNQCEFMLEPLQKENRSKIEIRPDLLSRPVDTVKFALAKREERQKAVEGIFKAPFPLSKIKKRIIVIDDVITTGSTMNEAIMTLRRAGARNVIGLSVGH